MATNITEMDATDLIGRLVSNQNGAEFIVTRLSFDAHQSCVIIWVEPIIDDIDDAEALDNITPGESGLFKLDGWTIHQPFIHD